MALFTISFREHSRGLNCNLPEYCCKRNTTIPGDIQGFVKVGNEEPDLLDCYSEKRNSLFLTF
jgi:hypothetical protein